MTRVLPLLLALALTGCYRYVPARAGAVPAGTEVRVHVSPEAAARVEPVLGSGLQEVDGLLERWGDEVVVSVRVPAGEGAIERDLRNRIILSPSEVLAIETRERDRARTALLAAGLTGVGVGALVAAISGVFGGSQNTDPPVEEDSRVPLFRIPIFQR
jgi:hypothetical protein